LLRSVFWALRGGGPGSWGVVVSATFRVYKTFNATYSRFSVDFTNSTSKDMGSLMALHATHLKDLDLSRAGQYIYVGKGLSNGSFNMLVNTFFPNLTSKQSVEIMLPFIEGVKGSDLTMNIIQEDYTEGLANDIMTSPDDAYFSALYYVGSRLFPPEAYEDPEGIGNMFGELLDSGDHV
jgi:hypothetical protein